MGEELTKKSSVSKANISRRIFLEAWLTDDRCKSWIRKVPSDKNFYYCTICDKNFSCSTPVARHADSMSHKNNVYENNLLLPNEDDDNLPKKFYRLVLQRQSLNVEEYKCWLREVPHDTNLFFCLICNKSFAANISQVQRHAESKAHIDKCKCSEITKSNEDLNSPNESLLSFKECVKEAEIRYAALIIDNNVSLRNVQEILSFFQLVGNDSILKNMRMSRTKCTFIVTNVLYPIEKKHVVNKIQNTKFTVFIDETSDTCNNKWMTFQARYVDPDTLDVRSQLIELINIDAKDSSAETLFEAFRNRMRKLEIPFQNIIALSCNNASVTTRKHSSFKKKLQKICPKLMIFLCPCHSAALIAHNACDKIPSFCEKFIKRVLTHIDNSPKRLSTFQQFCECFQQTDHKMLKLCDTRWLSRYLCVKKLLEYWDTIRNFLQEGVSDKMLTANDLLSTMDTIETKAYFLFLKYVLSFFHEFNAFFQALETRVYLLQSKSFEFLHQICQNFIKNDHLTFSLINIDFSLEENQKILNKITYGSECEKYLNDLIMLGHENIVTTIQQNCLDFYITAAEEIRKRLPVNDIFLSKLQVFKPFHSLLNSDRETSFNDLSFIVKTIGSFDEAALKKEWIALSADFTIKEKQHLSLLSFDSMWKEIFQCWHSNNVNKYPHLKNVLNIVRSLPNSNADSERTFSLLNSVKSKYHNSFSPTSVNAICVFKSALNARRENALSMTIEKEHLSLMSADTLYAKPEKDCSTLQTDIAGPSWAD